MYYNLLPQLKNAEMAGKETIVVPFSKMDFAVCKILVESGYLKDAKEKVLGRKKFVEIKVFTGSKKAMKGFKFLSKPSRHLYFKTFDLKSVKGGYGLGVVSTSRGVMTVQEARKNKIGGEYLFQVW